MRLLQEVVQGLKKIQANLQKLSPAQRMTPETMALRAMTPEDLILRIWSADYNDLSMFSAGFKEVVEPEAIKQSLQEARDTYGPAETVGRDPKGRGYLVTTSDYVLPVLMDRTRSGQASGFFIKSPRSRLTSREEILAAMKALAPRHSHLLTCNDETVAACNASDPLAIGSAANLFVLQALRQRLADRKLTLSQKMRLSEEFVSIPPGIISGRKVNALETVKTVAEQMIANSDNSATDLIMNLLGPRSLDGAAGRTPFLTTREFFKLKADPELAARYGSAPLETRLEILEELQNRPLPDVSQVREPHEECAGWYASAEELCETMGHVSKDPAMKLFLGSAEKADWHHVAYKGGSEIGTLSFTYDLETKGGTRYRFTAIWNDSTPINEPKALALMASLLEGLKVG